ncbi:hypothetical protein GCM10010440_67810 [Kitasatospora cinereorecta]
MLDGRPAVTERPDLLGFSDAEARWVCWMYGYRLTTYRQSRFGGELAAVLDTDPKARSRGDWMRGPVLLRGLDTPIPWARQPAGQWPPLWTPPGWPAGHGPVQPAPERMPLPTPEQIRERHQPGLLLVLAALFGYLALSFATSRPAGAAVLALFALGSLVAYLPSRRHRNRLIERTRLQEPIYDPPVDGAA